MAARQLAYWSLELRAVPGGRAGWLHLSVAALPVYLDARGRSSVGDRVELARLSTSVRQEALVDGLLAGLTALGVGVP